MRQRLVDLESQTAHARVDYHHAIKKLHAAGGSLREIAEALELSHQRVHQIVEGPSGMPGPPFGRRGWKHGRRHGGRRGFFIARFDDDAKEVMVQAQKEADSLKHNYVGTEHLMLAVRQARGRRPGLRRGPQGGRRPDRRGRRAVDRRPAAAADPPREARSGARAERGECRGPRAVRPGRHPARDRLRPERDGRRGPRRARRYTREAARAARSIAASAASPPPFTRTSSAAARAAVSARSVPTIASPPTGAVRGLGGVGCELRRRRGEVGHPERDLDRPRRGPPPSACAGSRCRRRRPRRRAAAPRARPRAPAPARSARPATRAVRSGEVCRELDRPRYRRAGSERLRRAQRCGPARRCRR